MVRAVHGWLKTQTRRVVKGNPDCSRPPLSTHACGSVFHFWHHGEIACPYGVPGDRLWVRETWMPCDVKLPDCVQILYKASNDVRRDGVDIVVSGAALWHAKRTESEVEAFQADIERMDVLGDRWRPSIYMWRWASRITLEIVSVRVERLLQISEEDAIAEGAVRNDAPGEEWDGTYLTQRYIDGVEGSQDDEPHGSARDWYREVWEGINGKGSWAANPWVWVVEFKKV